MASIARWVAVSSSRTRSGLTRDMLGWVKEWLPISSPAA